MSVSAVNRLGILPAIFNPPKTGGPKAAQNQNDSKDPIPIQPVKPVTREQESVRARAAESEERRQNTSRRATAKHDTFAERAGPQSVEEATQPSIPFLVQLLGQDAAPIRGVGLAGYGQTIEQHRDAAILGSQLYRQAGGEPSILSEGATFLSIAV